jgi:hypothetical protein
MPERKINGIVYRDGKLFRFINLFDEKIRDIYEEQYNTLISGKPITETSLVLVEFDLVGSRYKTHPIVVVDMLDKNSNPLTVKRLIKDEIINAAYKTATSYLSKL